MDLTNVLDLIVAADKGTHWLLLERIYNE